MGTHFANPKDVDDLFFELNGLIDEIRQKPEKKKGSGRALLQQTHIEVSMLKTEQNKRLSDSFVENKCLKELPRTCRSALGGCQIWNGVLQFGGQ